jgi:acetyl/propionyl-CoA carboxylase alpha subunit
MLAKVIAHGRDRDDAIRRLIAALEDAPLLGVAEQRPLPARPARPRALSQRDDAHGAAR